MRRVDWPLQAPWPGWRVSMVAQHDGRLHFQVENRELLVQLEGWARNEGDIIPNAHSVVRRFYARRR